MVSEVPSLPHADAVTSKALHIIFKLKDEMSETSPPAYKIIKSWIFSGTVAYLGLCGDAMLIRSNKDIDDIKDILDNGFMYYDELGTFKRLIGNIEVTLNLEFVGVGSGLMIDGRRVRDVNTTCCEEQAAKKGDPKTIIVRNTQTPCISHSFHPSVF
jgi:hypothetical protein